MGKYIIKRLAMSVLIIFLVSVFAFSLMHILPGDPIRIALGESVSEETIAEYRAKYHLDKLVSVSKPDYVRNEKERHNKFQVLKCPWCGTKMVKDEKGARLVGAWGYAMHGKHFYIHCPHENCHFTSRLPIQIIDEELYETPPTTSEERREA